MHLSTLSLYSSPQGHRRFVLRLMGAEEREGLDYPMRAIERNFSNFSAWHERARVLSLRAGERAPRHKWHQGEPGCSL